MNKYRFNTYTLKYKDTNTLYKERRVLRSSKLKRLVNKIKGLKLVNNEYD